MNTSLQHDVMGERTSQRIAGSFRDPSGYIFQRQGRIFRAIDAECGAVLNEVCQRSGYEEMVANGAIVKSEFVSDGDLLDSLRKEHQGYTDFLEHPRIRTISYPYEWSYSMLADAAIRTLDLQIWLTESGHALKDATAYNIQFVNGQAVFIDISSIERPHRVDIWFALGQFSQMFTFPLLLCLYGGWNLRSYFQANLAGLGVEEVARNFSWLQRMRPRLILDLGLPLFLQRWADKSKERTKRETLERRGGDAKSQIMNLQRLRSKVKRLADGYQPTGVWSNYTDICNYGAAAEQAKKSKVESFLRETQPDNVLDIGCNTGDYSYLAAKCGAEVVALDADHDAVELLYRKVREDSLPISPMVVDLCNPSPGLGYLNQERPPLLERLNADCVLALALMHHLHVSGNLPLAAIRDLLFVLTKRDVIFEYVPTEDDMFQQLMKFRVDLFADLTLDLCRSVLTERFHLLREESIPNSKRTLLFLRKK